MKKIVTLLLAAAAFASCSKEDVPAPTKQGQLMLRTSAISDVFLKEAIATDSYNVTITNNTGNVEAFNNTVANASTPINLTSGTYTVKVKSEDFAAPAFSKPVYGVSKSDVSIAWGATTDLSLVCKQTNAGIKVVYATAFTDYCTSKSYDFGAKIAAAGDATLDYGKKSTSLVTETGYFAPGTVTLKVAMNGVESTKTITLAAQDLVTVTVGLNPSASPKMLLSLNK